MTVRIERMVKDVAPPSLPHLGLIVAEPDANLAAATTAVEF